MTGEKADYLVMGAGISGLLCATILQDSGASVRVVDKGRGPGGRMSTRRMSGGRLDHGAQFFTVRTPEFVPYVNRWLSAGIVREWFRKASWDSDPGGHPRYCGLNGMSDAPKALASELDLELSIRLTDVSWSPKGGWLCIAEGGREFAAANLILTAPVPQSLELLKGSGIDFPDTDIGRLRKIDYEPSLAALMVLEGPSGLPDPGGIKLSKGPLSWLGDNTQKGISPDRFTVTAHSTEEFAREHWDSEDGVRMPLLIDAAKEYLQSPVVDAAIHRWRYNVPLNPWNDGKGYYWSEEFGLGLAGDGFGGPRVEGSALSGIRLGNSLAG